MKTTTEFSGTVIRLAARALAEAKAALPPEPAPAESAPAEAAPAVEGDAAKAAAEAPKAVESDATKAAISEAIAKETGLSGDRLALVRDALTVVGNQLADVRLVRVYAGEEAVPGAKKIGDHQFLLDLLPKSTKPVFDRPGKDKHRGRGGRGGGDGRRSSSEGPPTGGFSMDSIKSDKGGGGRGRGPGGPKK